MHAARGRDKKETSARCMEDGEGNEKRMNKVIGYVGTKHLAQMREEDIRSLDVVNIAFGHIVDGRTVWEHQDVKPVLARIRSINPQLKLVLSVGGWSADGFSQAASTEESRRLAADTAKEIIAEYGLDGIDIDWEYPGTSVAGIASSADDKVNFTLFLAALREAMDSLGKGKIVTIAAGGDSYFTRLTEMDKAAEYLDYVQLMTYDLQGGFQKVTGHHAALYAGGRNLFDACADKAVRAFMEAGVPAEKLVIGIPFYARKWEGVPNVREGLGVEAQTVGGFGASYGELLEEYVGKNGFVRYWDDEAKAPWLFDGKTFISYEDTESMAEKIAYVKEKGLCGVMYWEYGCDATYTLTEFLRREMDRA